MTVQVSSFASVMIPELRKEVEVCLGFWQKGGIKIFARRSLEWLRARLIDYLLINLKQFFAFLIAKLSLIESRLVVSSESGSGAKVRAGFRRCAWRDDVQRHDKRRC